MKTTFTILLIAHSLLAAAPITFESSDYATGTPLSTGTGTTADRLFDGQQGWSQSTSSHAGQIIITTTSGSYTGGQGLTANTSNITDASYIGAKAGGGLIGYSFDFLHQNKELGIGGWNDDDADGKFDQTEAEIQAKYFKAATAALRSLTAPPYFSEGEDKASLVAYAARNYHEDPDHKLTNTSLIWSDYYLLQALLRYQRITSPPSQ